MGKYITIKDIASQLGISPATVSRALKDSPEISSGVKAKVIALAQKLEYQPDRIASGLRQQKTMTIGVVVPSIAYNFNAKAIQGIEQALIPQGYKVLITQTMESFAREKENIDYLFSSKVDGIIASISAETSDYAHFEFIRKRDIPLVLIDRTTKYVEASEIVIDNGHATYLGAQHLFDVGCKKIVWLQGPERLPIATLRRRGYQRSLEEHNIKYDESLIGYCQFNADMGYNTTKSLLQQHKVHLS